jgi:hypothetical protein
MLADTGLDAEMNGALRASGRFDDVTGPVYGAIATLSR